MYMYKTPKDFINKMGGYRRFAVRVGVSDKTLHSHVTAEKLPPRWYVAFCALAREKGLAVPDQILFDFVDLPLLQQDAALSELGGAA